jgi:hypothetical protein
VIPVLTAIICAVAGASSWRAKTTSTVFSVPNRAADLRRVSSRLSMSSSTVECKA